MNRFLAMVGQIVFLICISLGSAYAQEEEYQYGREQFKSYQPMPDSNTNAASGYLDAQREQQREEQRQAEQQRQQQQMWDQIRKNNEQQTNHNNQNNSNIQNRTDLKLPDPQNNDGNQSVKSPDSGVQLPKNSDSVHEANIKNPTDDSVAKQSPHIYKQLSTKQRAKKPQKCDNIMCTSAGRIIPAIILGVIAHNVLRRVH